MTVVKKLIVLFAFLGALFLALTNVEKISGSSDKIPERRETTMIVVHHSATTGGSVEAFRDHHVNVNGWDDIGYHFVIGNGQGAEDGEIQIGRAEHLQGAHARSGASESRNPYSVGVCLVGNNEFTVEQQISLAVLLAKLCCSYNIEPSEQTIQRHHQECPGDSLDMKRVVERVKLAMGICCGG